MTSFEYGKATVEKDVESFTQTRELYPWAEVRPSVFCNCFSFVMQLVIVGCCGSFLFGFNISLLNTAIGVVSSEFRLCGENTPFASYLIDTIKTSGIGKAVEFCEANKAQCDASGCKLITNLTDNTPFDYECSGGYTDLKCPGLKWLKALLQSAILFGGIFGATSAGRIVRHGRRLLFLFVMMVFLLGVVSSVCANSFSAMFWSRLIVGFGVGLVSVASPTYISEMTPRQSRGKYGVGHQLSITVGIFCGILLGLALLDPQAQVSYWTPTGFTMFWWRFMLGLGLIPVIVGLYLLGLVYTFDTPIYYVEQKRYQDAFHVLERIYGHQDVKKELDKCIENVQVGVECKRNGLTFASAFRDPEYRYVILIGLLLAGFQQFGGINVFVTSSDDIFAKAGLSKSMQTGMSIIMAGINVVMTFFTVCLIESLGRRQLLFWGSLFQLCVIPCSVAYWLEANPEEPSQATQGLAIFAVVGFVTFFAVAFGPVVWVYLFEIFPLEIKDTATSLCTAFNWVSACIIVFVSNLLSNRVAFTVFSFLQLLATLFIFFFLKETKGISIGTSPYITQKNKATTLA